MNQLTRLTTCDEYQRMNACDNQALVNHLRDCLECYRKLKEWRQQFDSEVTKP